MDGQFFSFCLKVPHKEYLLEFFCCLSSGMVQRVHSGKLWSSKEWVVWDFAKWCPICISDSIIESYRFYYHWRTCLWYRLCTLVFLCAFSVCLVPDLSCDFSKGSSYLNNAAAYSSRLSGRLFMVCVYLYWVVISNKTNRKL